MKTLHLLRHAKSSWHESGVSDHQRGLSQRGLSDAPRMGAALSAELDPMPIRVSTAQRAQMTLEGLCEGWPELAQLEHQSVDALYTFDRDALLRWLRAQSDSIDTLFLIGHNPALTELVNWLDPQAHLDNLATAAYARLELDISAWTEIERSCASLQSLLKPRELAS